MLFLFPVLSLSVRHWLSGLYSLIFLASLFLFWRKYKELERDEKIILFAFIAFIISFLISATLNGWTDSSIRRLGAELKLVMFFPVYLAVRQQPSAIRWLFAGVVFGGIVIGLQAFYDTFFTSWQRGWGIYGSIIFGDLAALYFGFLMVIYIHLRRGLSRQSNIVILSAISLSVIAAILSGSRNAWIAVILILIIIGLMNFRSIGIPRLFKGFAVFVLGVILLIYSTPASIYTRADTAINEFKNYMDVDKRNKSTLIENSVGIRLEQWRVASNLVLEKPVFGFGGGNAGRETNRYVKLGKAHPDLYNEKAYTGYAGAHSAYFETMVTEGLAGLIIFLFLLLFPLYVFIKSRNSHPVTSELGIIFSVSFMVFSLTENPFVHDNFLSIYFVYFSVLYSTVALQKKEAWRHQ
jgi:O-antigen ligase